jgi:hypothetical protein
MEASLTGTAPADQKPHALEDFKLFCTVKLVTYYVVQELTHRETDQQAQH